MKFFIVNDTPIWTKVLSHILINNGYATLQYFSNCQACFDELNNEPAAVFLDYEMQKENVFLDLLLKTKQHEGELDRLNAQIK